MKYKLPLSSSSHQHQDYHDGHREVPPEERSTIVNDPNNHLRALIQHIRGVFIEQDEAEGVILMFGIEEQTGQIRISITKQHAKKEESHLSRYRHIMEPAIQNYEQSQRELTQGLTRSLSIARKGRIYYEFCEKRIEETRALQMLNSCLMELLENPRLGKQRSCSRDTAETLQQQDRSIHVPQNPPLSREQMIAMSLMQVD